MRDINIKTESGEIITQRGLLLSGELDINGKEICEGDKVKLYYRGSWHECIIVYCEGMFCLKWPDGYINKFQLNGSKYEII